MRKKIESWITVCDFCDRTAGEYKCDICGKDLCRIHAMKLFNQEHAPIIGGYTMWGPTNKVLINHFCPNHLHPDLVRHLDSKVKNE